MPDLRGSWPGCTPFLRLWPPRGCTRSRVACDRRRNEDNNGFDSIWVWPALPGHRCGREERWVSYRSALARQGETNQKGEECPQWRYQNTTPGTDRRAEWWSADDRWGKGSSCSPTGKGRSHPHSVFPSDALDHGIEASLALKFLLKGFTTRFQQGDIGLAVLDHLMLEMKGDITTNLVRVPTGQFLFLFGHHTVRIVKLQIGDPAHVLLMVRGIEQMGKEPLL